MGAARVYFWTFTFVQTQPIWRAAAAWSALQRQLFDWFGRFPGLRVAEMHQEHGLHFHVLVNERLPIAVVRRLAERYGFGRIEVQVVRNKQAAARYLVKYLAKGDPLPCPGMRRWSRFGGLGEPVSNFECQSRLAKITRATLDQAKASVRFPLTAGDRFKIIKTVRRSYDAGAYDEPVDPGFQLHNGPEIYLAPGGAPTKRRKVWNQWS